MNTQKRTIKDTFSSIFSSSKGFTLLELLVVVVIIAILAAIALPQYNKAVLKSQLHTGIPIVESLYRAQQIYAIANGDFATDIDDLDVEIPKNSSCEKQQNTSYSRYICDFGTIGLADSFSNVQYKTPSNNILYSHDLVDHDDIHKGGDHWCFAKGSKTANEVCIDLGGKPQGTIYAYTNTKHWNHYLLD